MDDDLKEINSSLNQAQKIKQKITFVNVSDKIIDLRNAVSYSLHLTTEFISTRLPSNGYMNLVHMGTLKNQANDIFDMDKPIRILDDIFRTLRKILGELNQYTSLSDDDSAYDSDCSTIADPGPGSDRESDEDFVLDSDESDESDESDMNND